MDLPRASSSHGREFRPELGEHLRELPGPGHHFNNTTARDNARVQYGDQYHHHYHAEPTSRPPAGDVEAKRLEELQEALAFPQMSFRFAAISNAYQSTCQWLFDTPEYTRWRDHSLRESHHGLLWLKGKPGSGKSTLTKCAVEYAQRTYADEKMIYFFFNARGDPLEKRVEGMFRSLLRQMVQDTPQLSRALKYKEVATYRSNGWPSELLRSLFHKAVCELSKVGRLTCYIDALDEGDEDEVRELVDFLEELLEHATDNDLSLLVYLASRHYPNISVHRSEDISLDDHEGHRKDISTYVHSQLRCRPASIQNDLAAQIMRRWSGVFLWVVLVIRDLNKQSDRGNPRLQSHLQAIPSGLNELFQRIVCESDTSEYTLPALQIVLFAHRNLEPLELYFAILSITEPSSRFSVVWDHNVVDEKLAKDFIISSSKGLLEVVIKDGDSESLFTRVRCRYVQFIHESAREYLLSSGMEYLDPTLSENIVGEGNLRLARWCQVYLNLGLQYIITPRLEGFEYCHGNGFPMDLPFLSYSWDGILLHSETAASHGIVVQESFEIFLHSRLWIYCNSPIQKWMRLKSTPTILHVLAHERCPNLIIQRLKICPPHHFRNYINADCPGGYPYVCNDEDMVNRTALQIAVAKRFPDIVELLLSHGADVNASYREGFDRPLHIVTSPTPRFGVTREDVKRLEMIRILLRYGAEANLTDGIGQTALHKEVSTGGVTIVQLLLQNGANPNAITRDHSTPLHMAVDNMSERAEIVRILLQHGADPNVRDITGRTALHRGVGWGSVEICKLFLIYGGDVNAEGGILPPYNLAVLRRHP